jgi:peptidoglycan/xylan/chitin deacetylase (PgdA/CDA1 family)
MDSMLRAEGDEMSANPDICRGRRFSFCMAGLAVACLVAAALGAVAVPAAAQGSGRAALAAVSANPAQAARSAVALAVDPAGTGYAFYRGQADAVYVRTVRSGSWSAQTNLGGTIIGAPAATVAGSAVLVAARGTDNALWVRTLTNGTWSPWRSWGGTMSASPAIAGASTGRVDAFGRAPRGGLWTRTMSPSGAFSAWTALGGQVITSPAAVAAAPGSIELYAVGTDHAVWRDALTGGVWTGWKSIGGTTYSAPAAAWIPASNGVWVFARGSDNALYASTGNAGAFGGWRKVGGVLIDGPAAAGTTAPGIDVAVRGTDNAVWGTSYRAGRWSGFTRAWVPTSPAAPASALLGTDWTRIPTTSKVVALTFDAGANAAGFASIESTLRAANVRASFFLTGTWARDFPAQANLIVQDGFLAGNHSMTHPYFTQLTDAQVTAQVQDAQQAVLRVNGADTRPLFRFPFGDVNSRVIADVNGLGYVPVRWTVDSLGWEGTSGGQTVQTVTNRVLAAAQPGEIVLMHLGSNPDDGTTLDATALPAIITGLQARGYGFVTLQALTGS